MAEKIPKALQERIKRGRDRMLDQAALRNECYEFYRGNQYVYRSSDGYLTNQSTVTNPDGSGKPRHRYRQVRNLIVDVVAHEVSAASQRTPTYEVVPSTVEDEDISAARLSQKVLLYGYDKWNIRKAVETTVTNAVVADEGYAWPYWDSSVGPFFKEGGETIGQGEIRIGLFGPNEVFWEPGVKFENSRWIAVEQARPPEEVMALEDYSGPPNLTPDARSVSDTRYTRSNNPQEAELALTTDYLERPSAKHPNGRWITISQGKQIQPQREYPCKDFEGNVLDEPVLHKLSYFIDPDSDRDQGLVRHLLDSQRTVNDTTNKQLIWKDMALNPQVIIKNGQLRQRLTDEPGAVFHLRGNDDPIWRPVPQIPNELQEIKEEARRDIAQVSAQNEIPSQVESGKAIQILVERDATRRGNFLSNLAEFYSRLGRHCLYLVQRHYTEERLLVVRGEENDFELLRDFLGSNLRGQADVRVYAGSIEPQTRQSVEAKVLAYADRGWIDPEQAMAAINNGHAGYLLRDYEKDVARARMVIQKIKDGPELLFQGERLAFPGELPPIPTGQIDPMGQPIMVPNPQTTVPAWMPRKFDNIRVHKSVFESWMKTSEFDSLPPDMQEAANNYYSALVDLEQQQMAEEQAQQIALAQQLGMENASQPSSAGMPSMPSADNQPTG
jgi:hypothetical protein